LTIQKPERTLVLKTLESLWSLPRQKRRHMREAAKSLKMTEFTLARYIKTYGPGYGIEILDPFGKSPSLHVSAESMRGAELDEVKRERDRLLLERKVVRRQLRVAQHELARAGRLREYLFGLTRPAVSQPKWAISPRDSKRSPHVPVLVASDFQWGEVIRAGNMGGLNEFNTAVAERRYGLLIDRTIDISLSHLPKNRYAGIIYLRLGDMISGEIHPDLAETNDLKSIPAVRSLVGNEERGIKSLADAFGHVWVISVPGNHGRPTRKPQSKRGAIDNFDTLSAWWLESMFVNDPRVSFHTPESGDALFSIFGERYLATHGDRIGSRGGEGFIGPAATIARGMKRTHDQYARYGTPITRMFVGHFHVALDLEYGWSNGSLPGYSEFARDGRMTPSAPEQWLIFFHPRYGATSQWRVLLEPKLRLPTDHEIALFQMEKAT